jgi:O-antigen ligase
MSDTVLTAWWESKLARRLHFVAGVAATVLLCRVALEENLSWVPWAIAGAAVVLLALARWPYGALLVLIGMSAIPVFFVEVFGWKARPEHFAAGIVSLAVGVWLLFQKRGVRLEQLDYCILAYLAINYASSAFTSPAPSDTLRWALLHNLAVLPYFVIRILVRDSETLRKAFRILLGVGIVESAYGILCYASNHALGTTTGMSVGQYLDEVAAPYGSLYEPNLFGAYTACCAVVFLALYLAQKQSRLSNLICFLIASLATVLSFSRAALLALVVVIVWVLWKAGHPVKGGRNKLAVFTLGFGLILLIAATAVRGVLQERFTNLFQQGLGEETTITRLIVAEEALKDIPNHPLLGSGTASFNLTFDWAKYVPEWGGSKTWIGNAPLRILHDAGLFGLTAMLGFFILVWRKIRRGLHGGNSQFAMLLGLFAGTLVYCISFQSSDGSNLAFFWVQLGFLASAAILMNGSTAGMSGMGATVKRSI